MWQHTMHMFHSDPENEFLASFNLLGNMFVIKWIITLVRVMHQNFETFQKHSF